MIARYQRESLPEIIAAINPDMGLLLSTLPETFSYTLSELMFLGVPPVATKIGSFADRIEHGVNGFLYEPVPESLFKIVRELFQQENKLDQVRINLSQMDYRSSEEMVADYHCLFPLSTFSSREYAENSTVSGQKKKLTGIGTVSPVSLETRPFSVIIERFCVILNQKISHTPRLRQWEKYLLLAGTRSISRLLIKVTKLRRLGVK